MSRLTLSDYTHASLTLENNSKIISKCLFQGVRINQVTKTKDPKTNTKACKEDAGIEKEKSEKNIEQFPYN